jgi:hypothetical protein
MNSTSNMEAATYFSKLMVRKYSFLCRKNPSLEYSDLTQECMIAFLEVQKESMEGTLKVEFKIAMKTRMEQRLKNMVYQENLQKRKAWSVPLNELNAPHVSPPEYLPPASRFIRDLIINPPESLIEACRQFPKSVKKAINWYLQKDLLYSKRQVKMIWESVG